MRFERSERELEMEGGPTAWHAGGPQTPTGLLSQPAAQSQADSLPICHLTCLRSAIAIEDRIRQLRFEANPLVPDDEVRPFVDTVEFNVDRRAGRRVLRGVAEQVDHDLYDGIRIGADGGRVLRQSPNLDVADARRWH